MMLGKVYLLFYNCCLALGWSLVLWWTISELQLTQTTVNVYKKVEVALKLSQTLAILEIVHPVLGLVRSSPTTVLTQIQSRLVVLWLVLDPVKELQSGFIVTIMICDWCVAEIIRYLYYALSLVGAAPYPLTWARYSFFTFLMPLGLFCELLTMYRSLAYFTASGKYSIALPNTFNVSFSYPTILVMYMLGWAYFPPKVYMHLLNQRGKALSSSREKKVS